MPAEKKLYKVTVEYTFYAAAESELAAIRLADEALNDAYLCDCTEATEVQHSDESRFDAWGEDDLIYHEGREDITLGSMLSKLPKRGA